MQAAAMKVKRSIEREVPGLGKRIRQARKADGRSLEALCGAAGLSRVYWNDIENEKIRGALPEETLRKIEAALDVDFGVQFDE